MSRISRRKTCLLLAVLLGLTSLPACGSQQTNAVAEGREKVLLCGFESAKEMMTMNLYTMCARVEITDDEKYVTDGEKAAKFVIEGNAQEDKDGNVLAILYGWAEYKYMN